MSLPANSSSNSTLPYFRPVELNTLALDVLRDPRFNVGRKTAEILLSSLSFGVLTILFLTSVYFLMRRGSEPPGGRRNVKLLPLLSTALLYVSTAAYTGALLWVWSSENRLISEASDGLLSPSYDGRDEIAAFERAVRGQSWILTIAISINFVIGDAIVWWRACVVWQWHRVVSCVGPLLVIFAIGNPYSQASLVSTLATNVIATSLIAYKAWKHRQLWMQHFAATLTRTTSQVLQVLALLVESGCIYCALLIFLMVYLTDPTSSQAGPDSEFGTVAFYFIYGCLVPLLAIYPTLIIVLVALKQSPIDNTGLSQVCQARRSMSNTLVFHHTTSESHTFESVAAETESPREGIPLSDGQSVHSLETSMGSEEMKDVENLT